MIQNILAAEAKAILNIPDSNPLAKVVELFLESKRSGGKVVISGVGKAGEVGRKDQLDQLWQGHSPTLKVVRQPFLVQNV